MIGIQRCGALRKGLAALLVGTLAGLAQAAPAVADDDGPETLAKLALSQLADGLKDYDLDAIEEAVLDLDSVYDKVPPKTLKKVVKGLANVLALKARDEQRWEGPSPKDDLMTAYQLTIGILYDKADGQKVLTSALKQKHIKAWPEVQGLILEGLGFRVDAGNIKLFSSYLTHADPTVVLAAASALGQYSEVDQKLRKDAVKALISAYTALDRAATKEAKAGKSEDAQQFLLLVEGAINESLGALTRQRFGEPSSWAAWFADNGTSDW